MAAKPEGGMVFLDAVDECLEYDDSGDALARVSPGRSYSSEALARLFGHDCLAAAAAASCRCSQDGSLDAAAACWWQRRDALLWYSAEFGDGSQAGPGLSAGPRWP